MRQILILALALAVAAPAVAFDLGSRAPAKPAVQNSPAPPSGQRQGGDTIADAVAISLPYAGTGTTLGFNDDYDEVCPYTWAAAPDVVYSMTPVTDIAVDIDMLGSLYDTKIYVRDADGNLIDCNDDFYPDYVSKLENVPLQQGVTYHLFIDGYGTDAGDYVVTISQYVPCVLECPAGAELEGEPPLVDGYVDSFNGGCQYPEFGTPFSSITASVYCGVAGWYDSGDGSAYRDTDWHLITMPEGGVLEITGDAEYPTYFFELGPQDCGSVGVVQNVIVGPCQENSLTIVGEPGSDVWFWVGPTTFEGPVDEYAYVVYSNLSPVATEGRSWTEVKSLFR